MTEKNKYEQYEASRRKINDEYTSLLESFGFAQGSMMIIWSLADMGRPCTQKEICSDWFTNKQTINSAAKKLIAEGYIDMAPSPENFREKLLTFTEKGRFFAMRTVGKVIAAEREAFARLSEEEQAEAVRINSKYYDLLKEEIAKVKGENE